MKINEGILFSKALDDVHCMICGDDYVHPCRVEIIMNDVAVIVTEKNRIEYERVEGNTARGVIIRRYYFCECGHTFMKEEEFHEGTTLESWGIPDDSKVCSGTIWRD